MATIEKTNAIINGTATKPVTDVTKLDPNKTYDITADGYVERKDPTKEKWYTVKQAAKELRIPGTNVRMLIYRGVLDAKEIPGHSCTGYIWMISETALTEYLEDPKKVRNPKAREDYNKRQAASMRKRVEKLRTTESEEPKNVDIPRPVLTIRPASEETPVNSAILKNEPIPKGEDVKLEVLITHIKALLDDTYQKGFEDGKLSVEHDISDEYRKGFEEGKKQAKEELLAMLKGV